MYQRYIIEERRDGKWHILWDDFQKDEQTTLYLYRQAQKIWGWPLPKDVKLRARPATEQEGTTLFGMGNLERTPAVKA